ncbi:MAG: hypothetical protein UY31_C0057G0003 [Candidatus Wolfebacteria bacterium GW2011_GWE1_48_7]|nr:MAG: hypothetical protein UY31_C0057G0003 [Candidatus Wolfebacteria bacterium GW2011_GWE1_48_7]
MFSARLSLLAAMRIYDLPYMKQYITWRCDRCNAIFKFDTDIAPLRCPDCLSPKEHLHQESNEYLFGKKISEGDANDSHAVE